MSSIKPTESAGISEKGAASRESCRKIIINFYREWLKNANGMIRSKYKTAERAAAFISKGDPVTLTRVVENSFYFTVKALKQEPNYCFLKHYKTPEALFDALKGDIADGLHIRYFNENYSYELTRLSDESANHLMKKKNFRELFRLMEKNIDAKKHAKGLIARFVNRFLSLLHGKDGSYDSIIINLFKEFPELRPYKDELNAILWHSYKEKSGSRVPKDIRNRIWEINELTLGVINKKIKTHHISRTISRTMRAARVAVHGHVKTMRRFFPPRTPAPPPKVRPETLKSLRKMSK